MAGVIIEDKETELALQRLAREQMIKKLLTDILMDMTICKLNGWDVMEFPNRLFKEISAIVKRETQEKNK